MKDKLQNLLTGFRKKSQHSALFNEHALKVEKDLWIKEVVYVQYLWICQKPLTH